MTGPAPQGSAEQRRVVADRYELERPLGRGGMGTVWLAMDRTLHRQVAVKEVMYPSVVSEDERSRLDDRTMREARAAARLSSPRTTTVHDVVAEDGRPWIVMEYVESRTLGEMLAAQGPLSPLDAARIGLDVLDALEAAHVVDVVHRDVKPGNVLLDTHGRAWLTDFGIATSVGADTLSDDGVLLGSPSFMAPERARGEEAGPFTDLWSLGATLYAAVEGRGPFDRGEAMATLLAVTSEPPRPPERAGLLAPVLLALLVKPVDERMTGWQARDALRQVVDQASRPLPPPPTVSPPTVPPPTTPPPPHPPHASTRNAPAPGGDPNSIARIDREDVRRLAAMAGKSFAKGAARAAVAGVHAWQEQSGRSHRSQRSNPSGPSGQASDRSSRSDRSGRGRATDTRPPARPGQAAPPGRLDVPPRGPSLEERVRHAIRLPLLVVKLVAVGLVVSVILLIVLVVLVLG